MSELNCIVTLDLPQEDNVNRCVIFFIQSYVMDISHLWLMFLLHWFSIALSHLPGHLSLAATDRGLFIFAEEQHWLQFGLKSFS